MTHLQTSRCNRVTFKIQNNGSGDIKSDFLAQDQCATMVDTSSGSRSRVRTPDPLKQVTKGMPASLPVLAFKGVILQLEGHSTSSVACSAPRFHHKQKVCCRHCSATLCSCHMKHLCDVPRMAITCATWFVGEPGASMHNVIVYLWPTQTRIVSSRAAAP